MVDTWKEFSWWNSPGWIIKFIIFEYVSLLKIFSLLFAALPGKCKLCRIFYRSFFTWNMPQVVLREPVAIKTLPITSSPSGKKLLSQEIKRIFYHVYVCTGVIIYTVDEIQSFRGSFFGPVAAIVNNCRLKRSHETFFLCYCSVVKKGVWKTRETIEIIHSRLKMNTVNVTF